MPSDIKEMIENHIKEIDEHINLIVSKEKIFPNSSYQSHRNIIELRKAKSEAFIALSNL